MSTIDKPNTMTAEVLKAHLQIIMRQELVPAAKDILVFYDPDLRDLVRYLVLAGKSAYQVNPNELIVQRMVYDGTCFYLRESYRPGYREFHGLPVFDLIIATCIEFTKHGWFRHWHSGTRLVRNSLWGAGKVVDNVTKTILLTASQEQLTTKRPDWREWLHADYLSVPPNLTRFPSAPPTVRRGRSIRPGRRRKRHGSRRAYRANVQANRKDSI